MGGNKVNKIQIIFTNLSKSIKLGAMGEYYKVLDYRKFKHYFQAHERFY